VQVYEPLAAEVARDSRAPSVKRSKRHRAKFFQAVARSAPSAGRFRVHQLRGALGLYTV
jgi:hypothetical protein